MNITLSAHAELVRRARDYAQMHQTTLNQMIRDYLAQVVAAKTPTEAAEQFRATATTSPGRSPSGWRFDRDAAHHRRGGER